ncbi:hypothetical protein [Variovorax fucosicus]|uniref:hypothetical protein n=1 Tax=Variovorax fucosicus TaxID=3053517 RepID=UPI00257711CC|nr:hypothetical protein [Variovorax sp. J22G47]MDM0058946.1 hypothetical protein [Variovorax sp. J22G47]
MNSDIPTQERSMPATATVLLPPSPPIRVRGLLAVPRLRDLPMSASAAEAKKEDVEVILDGVAILGYN